MADSNLQMEFERARASGIPSVEDFVDSAERIAQPFGPTHHETQCGFKIRGSRFIAAHSINAKAEILSFDGRSGEVVRMHTVSPPGASVLLILEPGTGVFLPALPGFLAALTIDDGELVDLAYEPSENTPRWDEFVKRAEEIRALRAIASSSMTRGVFRLEMERALMIAKRMQYAKGIDPTFGIYAAYAFHDLQRPDLIREMKVYMQEDLGAPLFDVALLSRQLNGRRVSEGTNHLSFAPLLAQGWALLSAFEVSLPSALAGLRQTLAPSLWTMFNKQGVELLRKAINSGEIK